MRVGKKKATFKLNYRHDINMKRVFILLGLAVLATGCIGGGGPAPNQSQNQSQDQVSNNGNLSASEWCQQNGNGEAIVDGCVTQSEALNYANSGGSIYYAGENPRIGCPDSQLYLCEN
jgi:hypothetical protein